ncbi:MAG: IS1595 family transposase ISPlba2, partial [Armatimonadetes bacterium CG06_land_8_20_14_3_00_66_21]
MLDFEARFSTDAACRECLSRLRWPEGFRCPRCEGARSGSTNRG